MVDAPFLEIFKVRLDETQSKLQMPLLFAEELDYVTFKGLFQPKLFYDPYFSMLLEATHITSLKEQPAGKNP